MGTKEKLTLSVDPGVVEKAKGLGINISELTERVLEGFTFEPTLAEVSELKTKYRRLFDAMLPLLKKFHTRVSVAEEFYGYGPDGPVTGDWIDLCPDGTLQDIDEKEVSLEDERCHPLDPGTILNHFVDAIAKGAERQKRHLKKIEMARRVVGAISESMKRE